MLQYMESSNELFYRWRGLLLDWSGVGRRFFQFHHGTFWKRTVSRVLLGVLWVFGFRWCLCWVLLFCVFGAFWWYQGGRFTYIFIVGITILTKGLMTVRASSGHDIGGKKIVKRRRKMMLSALSAFFFISHPTACCLWFGIVFALSFVFGDSFVYFFFSTSGRHHELS